MDVGCTCSCKLTVSNFLLAAKHFLLGVLSLFGVVIVGLGVGKGCGVGTGGEFAQNNVKFFWFYYVKFHI